MSDARTVTADLIVLGAGPAGASAALAASGHGLRVVLLDDAPAAGGQVWRGPSTSRARARAAGDPDGRDGQALRDALARSDVVLLPEHAVWSVAPGFEVLATSDDGPVTLHAPALVAAFGAVERLVPFPGWELPGVYGLAAATAMLKRDGSLPGRRIAIAGQGPLLFAVVAKALDSGRVPACLVDAASRADWARASPGFARSPRAFARGAGWMAHALVKRVPRHTRSAVVAAHAGSDGTLATIEVAALDERGSPDPATRATIEVDTLYVGNGLSPVGEVARLLGARVRHDALRGGFEIERDASGRTGVTGLFAVGDGAGVRGALPATVEGRLAGIAAALDAGAVSAAEAETEARPWQRRATRASVCADASCRLMQVPDARLGAIPADTIVCRCERVSRAAIDTAIGQGARTLDAVKHRTRLGMGPCQGRFCAINAATLIRLRTGDDAAMVGLLRPRVPLRPLPVESLTGDFEYADIPVPVPAPL